MRVPCRRFPGASLAVVLLTAFAVLELASPAAAQTGMVPYFGKNNIHYDKFEWHIYTTDHFEIYYYPDVEPHLERVAGYAESAYQQVSADLKHDLPFKVPLDALQDPQRIRAAEHRRPRRLLRRACGAFAEPGQHRMVLPIDEPARRAVRADRPRAHPPVRVRHHPARSSATACRCGSTRAFPTTSAASWEPIDLMTIRDAAVADIIPKMSKIDGYGDTNNPRLVYNLGHAVFEFIEARWGKEGLRSYLFSLRKSVIGGGEDAYEEALQMRPDEFDQAFDRYMKDRFKPVPRQGAAGRLRPRTSRRTARRRSSPRRCRSRPPPRAISSRRSRSTASDQRNRHRPRLVQGRIASSAT